MVHLLTVTLNKKRYMRITAQKLTRLQKGFTLIELIIVIAILGILAAALIALIDPVDKINSANDSKVVSDINTIYGAAQRYDTDNPAIGFPAGTAALAPSEINAVPTQPGGAVYVYRINGATPVSDAIVCGVSHSRSSYQKAFLAAAPAIVPATTIETYQGQIYYCQAALCPGAYGAPANCHAQ